MICDASRARAECDISVANITEAISLLQEGKSPGGDGIPIEFYKLYSNEIAPILKRVLQKCFFDGKLSRTMKQGIISLLYKGHGARNELKNWRPLTLLNVDFKILTKILAIRLKSTLKQIVHHDQTCSVPGRDIQDSVMSLYNTIEYMHNRSISGVIVSVDHKSAFDLIEWPYILKCLRHFGFGQKFISWVAIIYQAGEVNSRLLVNGFVSQSFDVTRGIRQGCPLSPLLYVAVTEVLSHFVRTNNIVRGIPMLGVEKKISKYADDTVFFLQSVVDVEIIFEIMHNYKLASGSRLTEAKTQILPVGEGAIGVPDHLQEYVVDVLKVYGVYFDANGFQRDENWHKAQASFELLQRTIPPYGISYEERVQSINTYFLSTLWYVGHIVRPPEILFRNFEKAMDRYIWFPTRKNLVPRKILKLPRSSGGILYPDMDLKLKIFRLAKVIKRALIQNHNSWSKVFDSFYEQTRNASVYTIGRINVPEFYKELRRAELFCKYRRINRFQFLLCGKMFLFARVTTKILYVTAINALLSNNHAIRNKALFWEEKIGMDARNFKASWDYAFDKYEDGKAKNIHF